jgi:hypothetical protein
MSRYCSVLPVTLLGLGSISPTTAVSLWIASIALANLAHIARRRPLARALVVYAAVAAPLLWLFTLAPVIAFAIAAAVSFPVVVFKSLMTRAGNIFAQRCAEGSERIARM